MRKALGCTCEEDPRTCKTHPYHYEGSNGTPRSRRDVSPNTRLTHSLGEKLATRKFVIFDNVGDE